jgi:hypothetical protein
MATLAFVGHVAVVFGILATLGLLDSFLTVTRLGVIQLAVPGHIRGRVIGNMQTVTRGVSPLAELQTGLVVGALGTTTGILVAAGALGLSAATIGRRQPQLWAFDRDAPAIDGVSGSSPVTGRSDA